jgi:aryl-alcohol dehydrogenase-like predicted oxidoreductase
MTAVRLPGTGLVTSMLGYGTAGFGTSLSEGERQRLLAAALDAGVTHFDTAPLYGQGTAEASLGRFVASRRDQLTITTKIGFVPPPGGGLRRNARSVARRLGVPAGRLAEPARASAADARRVLDESLRALRTDHVDLLLLHDVTAEELAALRPVAEDAVARGDALVCGLATDAATTRSALAAGETFPQVVQLDAASAPEVPVGPERALILHSVLARARRDSATELLRAAIASNPSGPVLFSSRRVEHVRECAAAMQLGSGA